MAVTYGFFNSVEGDRKYNADQMSEYFDGLVSNGVYLNVGGAFKVTASGSGLSVNVAPGRAIINCKWLNSNAVETVSISQASATKPRYTAICLRLNYEDRVMQITTHDGVAETNPSKPAPVRDSSFYDLILAYVLVPANASSISQANITDVRADRAKCGWVSGLIDQVDTSTLFDQFNTAYQQMLAQMAQWQATQQAQFEAWFATLTQDLTVGAVCTEFNKMTIFPANSGRNKTIALTDIEGYTPQEDDIIMVYINGLYAVEGVDYEIIDMSGVPVISFRALYVKSQDCMVNVKILQSKASTANSGGAGEAVDIMSFGAPSISVGASTETTLDPNFTNLEEVLG